MTEVLVKPVVSSSLLTFELDPERGVFHLISTPTGNRIATDLECSVRMADGAVLRSAGTRAIWRPLLATEGEGLEIQFGTETETRMDLVVLHDQDSGGINLTLSVASQTRPSSPVELDLLSTGENGRLDFCPEMDQ